MDLLIGIIAILTPVIGHLLLPCLRGCG